MKAKFSFEIMNLEDGLVAVPVGDNAANFHGVLKVNETGASVLKLLEQEIDIDQLVDELMQEYTGEKEKIKEYVCDFIETLKTEGVVE